MNSTLQERIRDRMQAVGLNNAQLAAACKVKPPTSFNWASGKTKNIKGAPLLLAARALGVTPEWLATGIGSKYSATLHTEHRVEEKVATFPDSKPDKLTQELLSLFAQLDREGKVEYLSYLRGFVAGRRPHPIGNSSAVAG